MQKFISTETTLLISMLGKQTPNLIEYIIQYSTPKSAKNTAIKPTKALSSKQIQEACHHQNKLVLQTLTTIATIYSALKTVDDKINELTKQRNTIENALAILLSTNHKGSE